MNNLVLDKTETGGLSDGAIEADGDSFRSHSPKIESWDCVAEPQRAVANANPPISNGGGISRALSVILFGYSIRAMVLMLAFMIIGLMVSSFVLNF